MMMMMMNNKSLAFTMRFSAVVVGAIAAVTLCSMMSMAQLIIENPADADQTPRFIRSSYIEPHHQQHTLPRFLQTSVGNLPDIVADGNMCSTYGGLEFQCDIYQRVGPEDDYMDLNITIRCELGIVQFDFRRASGCYCIAQLTPKNTSRISKFCPCFVCPIGFGSSSVSLDCTEYTEVSNETSPDDEVSSGFFEGILGDTGNQSASPSTQSLTFIVPTLTPATGAANETAPGMAVVSPTMAPGSMEVANSSSTRYLQETVMTGAVDIITSTNMTSNVTDDKVYDPFIFSTCVTLDCSAACNGTCALGCGAGAGPTCAFCENNENAPTPAPTGMDGEGIERIGGSGAAGACLEQTKMAAASLLLFMMGAVML